MSKTDPFVQSEQKVEQVQDIPSGAFIACIEAYGDNQSSQSIMPEAHDGLVGAMHHGLVNGMGRKDYMAMVVIEFLIDSAHLIKSHLYVNGQYRTRKV